MIFKFENDQVMEGSSWSGVIGRLYLVYPPDVVILSVTALERHPCYLMYTVQVLP